MMGDKLSALIAEIENRLNTSTNRMESSLLNSIKCKLEVASHELERYERGYLSNSGNSETTTL